MDNDVDMLVRVPEVDVDAPIFKESSEELSGTFLKIGITQLVLGFTVLTGGILATALSDPDGGYGSWWPTDCTGGGIWGGTLVLVCGSLAIAARYQPLFGVVVASLVSNLVASVALVAGIILAMISTFARFECIGCGRGSYSYVGFVALNCGFIACSSASTWLSSMPRFCMRTKLLQNAVA